jgi:hypothetical protein
LLAQTNWIRPKLSTIEAEGVALLEAISLDGTRLYLRVILFIYAIGVSEFRSIIIKIKAI